MEHMTDFFEELCADEAVCFIAGRHHLTPRQLLSRVLAESPAAIMPPADIPLEPNEVEILKDLSERKMKGR